MEDVNRPFTAMWNVRYGNAIWEDTGGKKECGLLNSGFCLCGIYSL